MIYLYVIYGNIVQVNMTSFIKFRSIYKFGISPRLETILWLII